MSPEVLHWIGVAMFWIPIVAILVVASLIIVTIIYDDAKRGDYGLIKSLGLFIMFMAWIIVGSHLMRTY